MKKVASKTLDTQHHRMLASFEQQFGLVQEREDELSSVVRILEDLDGLDDDKAIESRIVLTQKKRIIEKQLKDAKGRSDELGYLVDTADIIFKYYDIIEKGCQGEPENLVINKNSILKYFSSNREASAPESEEDRASLLERYMEQTDHNYVKVVSHASCDECPNCASTNRTTFVNDGLSYCNDCFTIETIIVDHEKPSYKDPPKEISYFCYKRINHLSESTDYYRSNTNWIVYVLVIKIDPPKHG